LTYCLGILLPAGLVLTSDSRSNAGIDQVAQVRKMALITKPGERVIAILSAGNLGTTQSVVTTLREAVGTGDLTHDVTTAPSMFEVAKMVGNKLREIVDNDAKYVEPYGDVGASFLVGGQIRGEGQRLFQIYSAGNFVEASDRTPFLQIGETKYGKPILDRALSADTELDQAAKLTLLSFDATMRSNLSVGPPIDMLRYEKDSFSVDNFVTFQDDNPYLNELRADYMSGLFEVVGRIPPPPPAPKA
jgi:putative proteasome-type protease